MHLNRFIPYLIVIIYLMNSCIEEYKPAIDSQDANSYVIEGRITDKGGTYSIFVSKSSEINNPIFNPLSDCDVKIYDDNNNVFEAEEYPNGEYKVYIDKIFTVPGTAFMLDVLTPGGEVIQSDYDTLRVCPEVDSIYYFIEEQATSDPGISIPTIQFYMDYYGQNTRAENIKIEIEETWKYTVPYPKRWTWDGSIFAEFDPPDYSLSTCWRTTKETNIYVFSTTNFSTNQYIRYPLHDIPNTSMKLLEGYSLLIYQLSVSEAAYSFYKKLEANALTEGGLYDTQPEQIASNLHNITNPDSRVLGYFFTAGIKSKRIFYNSFDKIDPKPPDYCTPVLSQMGFPNVSGLRKFYYLWMVDGLFVLQDPCVDCTKLDGKITKPEFWPN